LTRAYYELIDPRDALGQRFRPTDYVISGWSADLQNAAPVSALLVRALEHCSPRDDARLTRVVVDLLGPVPVGEALWVRAEVQRPGSRIELLTAQMLAPGPDGQPRPVATATAWRFQVHDTEELFFTPAVPLAPPDSAHLHRPDGDPGPRFAHSLEWRWLNDIFSEVPGECWARPKVQLVAGETMSAMQRLFTVADIANGVGSRLPRTDWLYLNTDIAVHIHRIPHGEWIGVRAETHYSRDGVGVSQGTLFDEDGAVASIQQAQLLRRRR
jgi:hypothetical protein